MAKIKSDIEIKKLHFGEKTDKYWRGYGKLERERKKILAHIPKAVKAEQSDNERYNSAIKFDTSKMRLPKNTDRNSLTGLQVEIENLLRERDAVNRELIALYNSNRSEGDSRSNTQERIKRATKGARAAYNKQRKLANEIDALRIPLDEKKKIFEPMNRITQLNADINDLEYRIEREGLKGRAKEAAKTAIQKKKKERKYHEHNVKRLANKAKIRARIEKAERTSQMLWILLILVIGCAAAAAWYFRADIMSYLKSLAKIALPENVLSMLSVLKSMFGGAING